MKKKQVKCVVIVTSVPFPNGYAPANRIINYCNGFAVNKVSARVVIIKPNQEINNKEYEPRGTFDGISYIFPGNIISGSEILFIRKFQYIYSLIASLCFLVYNYCLRKKADFLIFYGFNPIIETILTITAKVFSLSIYREESEYPFLFFNNSRLLSERFITFLYLKIIYKYYTGFLVMTRPIRKLLISAGITEKKILIINQTVSIDRFRQNTQNGDKSGYFAFIGCLNQKKDGILTVLDALAIVLKTYPGTTLKVAGYGSNEDIRNFKEKIIQLNLMNNVEYLGSLTSYKTRGLICNALGLLSARPDSIQAEYGFPTKIAEYLATANPVITTLTGELRFLLINNVNSFTVPTNNPVDFAESWLYLLRDPDNTQRIGKNGQLLAETFFNPEVQIRRILNFHMTGLIETETIQ